MDTKFTKVWSKEFKAVGLNRKCQIIIYFFRHRACDTLRQQGSGAGCLPFVRSVDCSQTPPVRKQLEGSVSLGEIMNLEFSSDTSMTTNIRQRLEIKALYECVFVTG